MMFLYIYENVFIFRYIVKSYNIMWHMRHICISRSSYHILVSIIFIMNVLLYLTLYLKVGVYDLYLSRVCRNSYKINFRISTLNILIWFNYVYLFSFYSICPNNLDKIVPII